MNIDLKTATAQEVFDFIVDKVIKQGKPAIQGKCVYLTDDGLKCAAGQLLDDKELQQLKNTDSLTSSWGALVARGFVPAEHRTLIGDLQEVHDISGPADEGWINRFKTN
jgi:hypothetical protein